MFYPDFASVGPCSRNPVLFPGFRHGNISIAMACPPMVLLSGVLGEAFTACRAAAYLCIALFCFTYTSGLVEQERPKPSVFVAPGASLLWQHLPHYCREREREREILRRAQGDNLGRAQGDNRDQGKAPPADTPDHPCRLHTTPPSGRADRSKTSAIYDHGLHKWKQCSA